MQAGIHQNHSVAATSLDQCIEHVLVVFANEISYRAGDPYETVTVRSRS
jgi:hypothetical protein